MANKKVVEITSKMYQQWKTFLGMIKIEAGPLKFTKTGKLKEICIKAVWYSVCNFQRFDAFMKKVATK